MSENGIIWFATPTRPATLSCKLPMECFPLRRYAQRRALTSDPNWQGGHYYDTGKFPFTGMKAARIIGHITYRSGPEWQDRFGNMQLPGDVHKQVGLCVCWCVCDVVCYVQHC